MFELDLEVLCVEVSPYTRFVFEIFLPSVVVN